MRTDHYHKQGATPEWETPKKLFNELDAEFGFDVDVCATKENAKCELYFSPQQDGLNTKWYHRDRVRTFWMNPPYGRAINDWMKKAYNESLLGATVVCLIPSRTDTGWWHDYAMKGEIRFIRGRLKFGGAHHNAPFPSAIVIFRGRKI